MAKSPDAFRTISEVSDWLGTPAHVLRFWESRFSQIKPVKRAGGRRYYRRNDMLLLSGIRRLLHEDGLTIKGVQKVLKEQGVKYVSSLGNDPLSVVREPPGPETGPDETPAPVPNETEHNETTSNEAEPNQTQPSGTKPSAAEPSPSPEPETAEPEPALKAGPETITEIPAEGASGSASTPPDPAPVNFDDDARMARIRDLYARLATLRDRVAAGVEAN